MLRRPRPEDELHLLETLRYHGASVALALELAFVIVEAVDVAAKVAEGKGRPLSPEQRQKWRYKMMDDFFKSIGRLEDRWIHEEDAKVWFWTPGRRDAVLRRKWGAALRTTGAGGVRHSLRRIAREFVDEWIRKMI